MSSRFGEQVRVDIVTAVLKPKLGEANASPLKAEVEGTSATRQRFEQSDEEIRVRDELAVG